LTGILNGINGEEWNPSRDPFIAKPYSARRLQDKLPNKLALQKEFGLPGESQTTLIGMVGRLVQQKGIDLVLETLPGLMHRPLQLVILGTGEAGYETALRAQVARYPGRLAVHIGYDERLAHLIEAGADMFLMPSRFEPCGLNQLYSLRYGTIPIVRHVGGLADTVVDATEENLKAGKATGVVLEGTRAGALLAAVDRALALQQNARRWKQIMRDGMRHDFTWRRSAAEYLRLYKQAAQANRQHQDNEPNRKDAHVPGKRGKRTGPKQ
jgi:starch synthase